MRTASDSYLTLVVLKSQKGLKIGFECSELTQSHVELSPVHQTSY